MTKPLPNDDGEIDPAEIETASDETPGTMRAPELTDATAELTTWDEPVDATGGAAPKVRPEDEKSPVQQLIDEGLDEADRDQRLAAVDPDFEP